MDLADGQGGDSSDFLDFKAFSSRWEWKWIEVIKFRDDLLLVAQQNGSFDSPKAAPSAQNPRIWPNTEVASAKGERGHKRQYPCGECQAQDNGSRAGNGVIPESPLQTSLAVPREAGGSWGRFCSATKPGKNDGMVQNQRELKNLHS